MPEDKILDFIKGGRIALLSFSYSEHNGIGIVMKRQVELLKTNGYDVTIFCFESDIDPDGYDIERLYVPENATIRRIYRVLWPVFLIPLLRLTIRLRGFDTIISHKYPFNVACILARSNGCRFIYYDHGVAPPSVYQDALSKGYSAVMRKLQAISARPADVVITISKFVATELEAEGGPPCTEIIYNSIPETVQKFPPDLRNIRKEHYIPADGEIILFVGRITKHKNIHCLIEAHRNLCDSDSPSPYLVIIGKPTQEQYYERISKISNKNVRFAGYVDEEYLSSYYHQADIYATASLWEGCNLTVLEAQEVGIPVVAFDAGAHPETVEVPPGELVRKGDRDALSEGIKTALYKE